jgi:hypothetical protein
MCIETVSTHLLKEAQLNTRLWSAYIPERAEGAHVPRASIFPTHSVENKKHLLKKHAKLTRRCGVCLPARCALERSAGTPPGSAPGAALSQRAAAAAAPPVKCGSYTEPGRPAQSTACAIRVKTQAFFPGRSLAMRAGRRLSYGLLPQLM